MKTTLSKPLRWLLLFASFAGLVGGAFSSENSLTSDLSPIDSDKDGLPDDWERRCYGELTHSGTSDTDGDGLSAAKEFALGTYPTLTDTDSDGMPDGWEADYGFDPTNAHDSNQDHDFDSFHNLTEYLYGTDPTDHYNSKRPDIAPPQPTKAKAMIADGMLRVEWNDNSISETAFAIYKRTLGKNGKPAYQLLGKETPAATLFMKDIKPNEVLKGEQIVVIAEPSALPPVDYFAVLVDLPFIIRCNDAMQTYLVEDAD